MIRKLQIARAIKSVERLHEGQFTSKDHTRHVTVMGSLTGKHVRVEDTVAETIAHVNIASDEFGQLKPYLSASRGTTHGEFGGPIEVFISHGEQELSMRAVSGIIRQAREAQAHPVAPQPPVEAV